MKWRLWAGPAWRIRTGSYSAACTIREKRIFSGILCSSTVLQERICNLRFQIVRECFPIRALWIVVPFETKEKVELVPLVAPGAASDGLQGSNITHRCGRQCLGDSR